MSSSTSFEGFAARLREFIFCSTVEARSAAAEDAGLAGRQDERATTTARFEALALALFALQYLQNRPFREFCDARRRQPKAVEHWSQIPAMPAAAFKEWELSCLPPAERTTVFYSSGTTGQQPSRHFHNAKSLALYEASLLASFERHVLNEQAREGGAFPLICLTPPPAVSPHSSLVHMFATIRQKFGSADSLYAGVVAGDGAWALNLEAALQGLRHAVTTNRPVVLLGTAFSFVHLLDGLAEKGLRFNLPPGSRAMETGGYKGRSRSLPRAELHSLLASQLGIPASLIICEYGMSELSSQAYDCAVSDEWRLAQDGGRPRRSPLATRHFSFPPWARVEVVSPETGCEVGEGETGLLRVFDLANVYSVMAIQTADLGIRRGTGFELLGRAALAEPRGCSLMAG